MLNDIFNKKNGIVNDEKRSSELELTNNLSKHTT